MLHFTTRHCRSIARMRACTCLRVGMTYVCGRPVYMLDAGRARIATAHVCTRVSERTERLNTGLLESYQPRADILRNPD